MIGFKSKGDFSKTQAYLKKLANASKMNIFDKYGKMGVAALARYTPVDTGKTASSWYYRVEYGEGVTKIIYCNSNVNKNVSIAMILQYGHGTGTGGWVEGRDYINPALRPVFDAFAKEAWEEVSKL